jgi:hypothetical protein
MIVLINNLMSNDKATYMQLKTDVPLYRGNVDDVTDDVNHDLVRAKFAKIGKFWCDSTNIRSTYFLTA